MSTWIGAFIFTLFYHTHSSLLSSPVFKNHGSLPTSIIIIKYFLGLHSQGLSIFSLNFEIQFEADIYAYSLKNRQHQIIGSLLFRKCQEKITDKSKKRPFKNTFLKLADQKLVSNWGGWLKNNVHFSIDVYLFVGLFA